jgi:VCBS repeat-containing protein
MKKTPARQSTLRLNTANRLRGMLGIPLAGRPRKARPQVREQMVIEAIEPRVLLSAEALVLPPPPSEEVQVVTDAAEQARLSGQQALLLASGGGSQTIDLSGMAAASLIDQSARQSAESTRPNEVVFVDPRVADYRKLLDQALQGRGQAEQARVEVVVLDLASDGVDQIANWLGQYQDAPLQAVHILSHGESGELMIGSTVLDGDRLDAYADRLGRWAAGLADSADLLLYGCNVAEGAAGQAFVDRLASLTGADVSASDDRTGSAAMGGDWLLETRTGSIETRSLAPDAASYSYLLSSVTPSKTGDTANAINVAGAQAAFRAATNLGIQLDVSSEIGYALPMADLPFSGLIRTADGRTLGDVLSFRTTANTTVVDDYLASTASPTMGGLMDRIGDYLNGRGAYSQLESLVDNAAGSPSIALSASGDTFSVNLSLSRSFLQHFGFGEKLKPLGFDFQSGQGVSLVADIHYAASYDFSFGAVQVNTLNARIHTASDTFNAGVVLGVLDAQASGTLRFDTGTIAFNGTAALVEQGSPYAGFPFGYTAVKSPFASDYQASDSRVSRSGSQPRAFASADFDIDGSIGSTALSTIAGGTPHVSLSFGGLTLDSATVNSVTPVLSGTATVLSGQQLVVSVSDGSNTVSYAATPAGDGSWTVDMASATVQSGSLTLVNGQTYTVTAQIKRGSQVSASATGSLVVATGGLQAKSLSANTVTPTLSGAATLLSGQTFKVTVTDQADATKTATYTVTPSGGLWSLDLSSAVPTSGSLTLVTGHTYSVVARIYEGAQVWSAATATLVVNTALGSTTVTATVNGSAAALARAAGTVSSSVPWSSIQPAPLVLTTSNFSALQAFSSLDATELVGMLKDLGAYLQLLRDSGRFDALLPFTNVKLGTALDFSAAMQQVLDEQLTVTLLSGLTGSAAVSPVLAGNTAFDLYLQRPADERPSVITITVNASETAGFTHINQLAALVGQKVATAVNGLLGWEGSLFDVTESLKGGLAVNGSTHTDEEQLLNIHATAGTYQLKLGSGGTATGPISVLASPIEVQQALESVLGAGNVVVTGRSKFYQVQFTGALAGTDQAALQVVAGADVVAGSVIDVTASDLSRGTDGLTWGKLNLSQATPGEFSVLRVAGSSGLSIQQTSAGSDSTEAVQRLFIVHGGAGTFVLKGTDTAGNAFTTSALAYNASTADIASALHAVLPSVTGLSVADVSPDYAADNLTRVFDIAFGKKNATDYGAYAAMTVETTGWASRAPALAVVETRQTAADAVGSTPAANEIQRLSLANVSGGSFSLGVTLDALFYQTESIAYGSDAATIKTAVVNMLKLWKPTLGSGDVSVTAVGGRADTWDIEFTGALAGEDMPQMRVNSLALTSPTGSTYGSMARLGLAVAGQEFQIAGVTRFATLNELMARFQQAISASGLSVSPAYDAVTRSLTFSIKLALPESTEAIPISLGEQIGELSALTADTTLDFTSNTAFQTKIGLDFSSLNTFALRAAGTYGGTITANATDKTLVKWSAGPLGLPPYGTSSFSLVFDGESYDLTLDSANTSSNTTRADLVADIQAVINAKTALSGGVLDRLGFSNLGEAVKVGLSSANQLQLTFAVPVSNAGLVIADSLDPLKMLFGFKTTAVYPSTKAVTLATDGKLSAAAHFQLKVDQSDAISVTVPADASNTSLANLVADINAAFNGISVSSHAYLGSAGLGFAKLGDVVQAIVNNGQIELVTQSSKVASLQILISGRDTATTELGFTPGQFATTNGAYVFLQDASVAASYSAIVHGQVGSTPATLASAGQATLGMLDLSFTRLKTDYGGSMAFSLRNGLSGAAHDRISLNDLYDSAASQTALLGLGGDLTTSSDVSATAAPFQSNGRLLRDVGLSVTVGTTVLDVVVTKAATSTNSTIDDLATDVDAAIHAALVSQLGSDPYAAHTFVSVTDTGTEASPLRVLTFTAPTTTLTLASDAAQIYDATTGQLATDLRLSVAVAGLANPVDVLVRSADTTGNSSLADLVTSVSDAIDQALASARSNTNDATAQANIDTLIAATDLVGQGSGALTLKGGVVTAKTITLKNLAIAGRLLDADFITTPAYRNAAGTVGTSPVASLQFSGIGLLTPAAISADGLVPATTITISVSNTAALFAGAEAEATVTVVPDNGLGVLTPLKDVSWADITADLGQLGSLVGDMGQLGAFGELGRALPLLGTSLSEIFDFATRFASIDNALANQGAVGLNGLQAALATAFGVEAASIGLALDSTSGSEALRVTLPYRVLIDKAVSLELIFNDEALLNLFSPTQQAMLAGLVGSITRIKDAAGAAKLQLHADLTFNLDFGIDLSNTASKGRLFLYDHVSAGAAGLTGDTGTFARLDALTATGTGMNFESSQGIYRLGIAGGSASVTVASGSGFTLQSDSSDGAADGRLYLRNYGALDDADATALKASNFDVFFDGSASATLPMTLQVSDQLGQLAMEQIDGFINPLPLGKMEIAYRNLGDSFARMGGAGGFTLLDGIEASDSHTVISSQVAQAVLPARPVISAGSGTSTPEGAPVDNDNEGSLPVTNPDPYISSTEGAGASTTPSGVSVGSGSLFGSGSSTNPSSAGYDISLVLPDFEYWQVQLGQVLKSAIGEHCDETNPINGPLIFLLRDPTIIVDTVDKVLESIQKGLDAFSSVLDLPIIGDQLKDATQFVANLRGNVVDAIKNALANAVDVYGGLDNALRMSLFDMLTTDTNGDSIIQASELSSNVFLNFLRDYNGDQLITPDDIVVEYLAGFSQPELDPALTEYLGVSDGNPIPAVIAGQRTAWVTSGINVVKRDADGNIVYHDDGTPCYVGEAGQVVLDQSLQRIVDNIADAIESVSATASDLIDLFGGIAESPSFFNSLTKIVTFIADKAADGYDYQHLLTDVFGAGVTAAVLTDVADSFRPSNGALAADAAVLKANLVNGTHYVPKAVLTEFKQAIKDQAAEVAAQVAINQSTAIQFRMNLGQTYTPSLDLSFDMGVPGVNLSLAGGIGLTLNWDLYLGFGVDLTDGFYVVTNMPGNAGIGQVTTYSADPAKKGVATGVADNVHDAYIDNLWLVGKPGQTAAVKELQATVDVYLAPGAGNTPARLDAQLFFLNGTMTDNWDGWIRDNDTGIWGSGTDSMGRLPDPLSANYGRTTSMFDGDSGANGSRTRLQLHFGVDLKDVGLFGISALSGFTNGRLTYTDISNAKLSDLIKVDWDARAQINLHMELGVSLGGEGYLPSILGDFHMTWMADNKNQYVQKIDQFFASGYDKLFKVGAPSIWFSDVYLDAGTFFTRFLNPIVRVIQDVTDPIMPVIDALTTPIPGLSDLMGRDYSVVDLASDMSALFGGVSRVDFIIAMVRLLEVIDNLPTSAARMLIPVAQSLIVSGTKDRKLNLAALPALPGIPNIDVPVDLPYLNLADVAVKDGDLEFSVSAGVGWKTDTTLLEIFKGNLPSLSFDFALNADVKVPAPYIDVTPVNFTIPGILDRSGHVAQFTLNIKAGWPDLRLSDILSGNFAPRFDVTVVMPDIDLTPDLLPRLKVLLPKMTWAIGSHTWEWAAGGEVEIHWPTAVESFVSASTIQTIDLTATSFNVALPGISAFLPTVRVKWPTVHWVGLGKEFTWEQTSHTDLGWSSLISDAGLLSALVDPSKVVEVTMPDVWLPSISLMDLLPSIDWSISLPSLPSLPSINIGLPNIDVPGQQTVGPMDALNSFKAKLKKPGNALTFPILDDPLTAVINMLTGKPADLMLFSPQNLEVKVGFRVSYPIYPPLYVGIGGEIKLSASLTIGFDTYGISKFFNSHNLVDIFDGFYVSDNIVNGVDLPEVRLDAKLVAFAELNAFIIRGGVEGGIKLTGTLDIYDENRDNKYRASELIAAVSEDPLDVVSMSLRGSAYVAAYVDIFLIFDWERVWEWTFMDVTLFTWEHDPASKKPILGTMSGSTLSLNAGSGASSIDGQEAVTNTAADRKRRSTDDGNESYTLTGSDGTVNISATLTNGQTYTKTFVGVSKVKAASGAGNDTFDASGLDRPVLFIAGSGTDTLIGGSADDVLIGSDAGTATLRGNGGNDLIIARGGTTSMIGGSGDDIYRVLGNWGQATITDTSGANVVDFSRQTAAVTVDDTELRALRGTNTLQWASATTIDEMRGGTGGDILDLSGNTANLLVSLTGTNAGWVKGTASGMTQTSFSSSTAQAMKDAGDNAGRGYRFTGFENIIGGQGSDVFRIRDSASVTGSLIGNTDGGRHHNASGDEIANARNTLDFSEYTRAVQVNEEGNSAFGSAGATTIQVRAFHNIFGGTAGDRLTGDGRNNMLVGNDGTDTLEGQAAHDLLVADTFVTYGNLLTGQTRPLDSSLKNVADYLSLQAVGAAEFGAAARNWIWKGQTLENRSLTTAGAQTLKGGSGSDVILGALGGDIINIGGSGEGNDTILADLGRVQIDFLYRSALSATSFGNKGGGNDTIYLGSGSNLLIAGNGKDTIYGADSASSVNVVLTDNGTIQYKTVETPVAGQTKLTFAVSGTRSHLLDYVEAPVAETGGTGNDDTVRMGSGSAIVFGGAGQDAIAFNAASSSGANTRFIAGDHARLDTDANGSVTSFASTDTAATSGGNDTISVGSPDDLIARHLGSNYLIGGMGSDTLLVSAAFDATTGITTQGAARSVDVIVADNGSITRPDGDPRLSQVVSTQITAGLGGNDRIVTANGDKTIIGGVGNDTVSVGTTSTSTRLIAGDNADITYASPGSFTSFSTLDTLQTTGGIDTINVGTAASTGDLGSNYILSGMEADTVYVAASWNAATSTATFGSATTTDVILSDNGAITRPSSSTLLSHVYSTNITAGLGGDDRVLTANGDKTIIGGVGNDTVNVGTTSTSTRLIAGDNADITYTSPGSFTSFSTLDVAQETGGIDAIQIGTDASTGDLGSDYILGGMEVDTIHVAANWNAATSTATFGSATTTDVILSDNGVITRPSSSTLLSHVYSTNITAGLGGDDRVLVANGDKTIIGGVGHDLIHVGTTSASTRLIAGDNADITYDSYGGFVVFQTTDLIAATGGQDVIRIGDASSVGDLGYNFVFGGMEADQVWISAEYDSVSKADRMGKAVSDDIVVGDNGRIERAARTASAPNQLLQVVTTRNDKGGDDRILTANGSKVLVGGFGADIIHARDGDALVMGDNAQIDYDAVSRNGVLRSVVSTDIVIGGNDTITLEEGFKLVSGGFGADTIQIEADNIGNVTGGAATSDAIGAAVWAVGSLARVTGVVGVAGTVPTSGLSGAALAAAQTGNRGRNGRFIAGDNVRFEFDDQSGLTAMSTIDPIAATGGADSITLGTATIAATADLGYQVVMGGMAADTITVREQAASTDLILGDNGDLLRKARGYATLSITSTVPESGGADTILSGRGDKIVVGGAGADNITLRTSDLPDAGGAATASNRSIVLGDSGVVAFDASGGGALQRIESTNPSLGGDDTVSIGDGDVSFIGGYGRDTLAVNSNRSAFRIAAGDNARFSYAGIGNVANQAEDLIGAQTLDLSSSTGDGDSLRFGVSGSLTGVMGQAILIGGIGADRLTVTGQSADALLIGDNGQLTVVQGTPASGATLAQVSMQWANGQPAPASTSYLEGVATLTPDLGAGDVLETTSGTSVLIGGQGGDTLRAGRGNGVVFGDGAALTWSAGVLRQAASFGVAQGGSDTIELGAGGGTNDGHKIVVGGFGGDNITFSSVQGSGNTPETARERAIAGDNATVILDAGGRITGFATLDTDLATGGNDTVQLSVAAASPAVSGLTDLNIVAGGVGGDTLTVGAANRYTGVASGDNLDYRRSDGSASDADARYRSLFATVLQPFTGGDDTLRLGSGELIAFGGAGSDRIEASTAVGDSAMIFGDAGTAAFDIAASGRLEQLNTLADASGGNDTVAAGAGTLYLFGGAGSDNLGATAADNTTRIVLGDTGQVNFSAGVPGLIQTSTDDAPAATSADTITVPLTDGSGTLGHNFVVGGAGQDILIGSISAGDRVLAGSGMIDAGANSGNGVVVSVTVLGNHGEFGYGTTLPDTIDGIVVAGATTPDDGSGGTGGDTGGGTGGSTGGTDGSVTEYKLTGTGEVLDGSTQTATGRIAYPSLTSGLAVFAPVILDGSFGSLTLSADGSWSYTLAGANSLAGRVGQATALQALGTGESKQEVFHLTTTDGSATTVTITVTGRPLEAFAHSGNAREAGGVLNAIAGAGASATAASGGVLDDAIGTVADGTAIARVTAVSAGSTAGTVGSALAGRFGSLTLNADGSYTYVVDDAAAATENLAAGETGTDSFTFTVTRDGGRSVTTTLDIAVAGADDTPVTTGDLTGAITEAVTPAGVLATTGSIAFSDVDLADTHSVSGVTPSAGALGTLSATVTTPASDVDGTGGVIAWAYSVNAADVEYLAAGQTRVETFTLAIHNGRGGSTDTVVTVTITGTNDAPVVALSGLSGAVTEAVTPVGDLTTQGRVAFSDADLTDSHAVLPTITASAGALGSLTASVTTPASDADGQGGEITWQYRVAASAVEYLSAGETKVETFTLSLDDGHGGITSRSVTVTLTGTNDAPVVATVDLTGAVTEAGAPVGNLTDSGRIAFIDVDHLDSHRVLPLITASDGAVGRLTAGVDGDAIAWTYSVAASAVEYLAVGETKVETFTLRLDDGQGGTVARTVTVRIAGTNDAPVASADSAAIREDDTLAVDAATGVLANDTDVDASDLLRVGAVGAAGTAPLAAGVGTAVTGTYGTLVLNADGSYTYAVDTAAGQALKAGQAATETFTYVVADGHGGTATQTLALAITGSDDHPTVGGDTRGAVKTDRNLVTTGTLTVVDADAGESGFVAGELAGLYGTLVLDAAGGWTYTADPARVPSGLFAIDAIGVTTLDGSGAEVRITVNGPDAILIAALSPTLSGQVFGGSTPILSAVAPAVETQAALAASTTTPAATATAAAAAAETTASGEGARVAETPAVGPSRSTSAASGGSTSGPSAPSDSSLGSAGNADGAALGAALLPPVQRAPVVIPQTVGIKVFTPSVSMMNAVSFGQNIRIAMSPLGTPGEIDRQNTSGVLQQQDSTRAPGPDTTPVLPQVAPPEASVAPAIPALPVGDVEPELTELRASSDDILATVPAEPETAVDSDTTPGAALAAAAGGLIGARRIQWTLPAADKASSRRASGRRAA